MTRRLTSRQLRLRNASTETSKFFQVERKERYAIVRLNKPPVNTFNLDKFAQLNEQLDEFESDLSLNGVILTSVKKSLFLIKLKFKYRKHFCTKPLLKSNILLFFKRKTKVENDRTFFGMQYGSNERLKIKKK